MMTHHKVELEYGDTLTITYPATVKVQNPIVIISPDELAQHISRAGPKTVFGCLTKDERRSLIRIYRDEMPAEFEVELYKMGYEAQE
jgi:hypothetical protein